MFGWLLRRMRNGRISLCLRQASIELFEMPPGERAWVLVSSGRLLEQIANSPGGARYQFVDAMSSAEAYEYYFLLEGMLIENDRTSAAMIANTRVRLGEKFAEGMAKNLRATQLALRLQMCRVARAIDPAFEVLVLNVGRELIIPPDEIHAAVEHLLQADSLTGAVPHRDSRVTLFLAAMGVRDDLN